MASVLLVKIAQDLVDTRFCGDISSLKPLLKLHFLLHFTTNPLYSALEVCCFFFFWTNNFVPKIHGLWCESVCTCGAVLEKQSCSIINLSFCSHLGALNLSHNLNFTSLLEFTADSLSLWRPPVVCRPQISNRLSKIRGKHRILWFCLGTGQIFRML